jgi:hypothetical protein
VVYPAAVYCLPDVIPSFCICVYVSPIPRYVTGKCCDSADHVENYDGDDFESEIISGIESQKRLLDFWASEHQLSYRIVDATELVDPVDPILRNRVTRSGIPLWST